MTSKERIINVYECFKNTYGEWFAQYMLPSIIHGEQQFYRLSFEESAAIYAELVK